MGLPLKKIDLYDNSGGLDLKSSPTKGALDEASLSLNMSYTTDGSFLTRKGSSILNTSGSPAIPSQISGAPRGLGFYDYRDYNGNNTQIICAGSSIYHSLTSPVAQVTGLTSNAIPDFEFLADQTDDYLFFGNGIDTNKVFNGTSWVNWSLPRPSAPSATDNGAGLIGAGTYKYYFSHAVTSGGIIIKEGELSPVSGSVTIAANHSIQVTVTNSSDTQVNAKVIYRQLGTGAIYRLTDQATISDNTTTTYIDSNALTSTTEAEFDNQAAPTTAVFESNDFGEMFIVDASKPTNIYVAKPYRPWNVPDTAIILLDGPCNCIKRVYGAMIFSTSTGSLWVMQGSYAEGNVPRRISSKLGILNNRCAVGESTLYILGNNLKFYSISPTDFSQSEMRLDEGLSAKIDPLFKQINKSDLENVCMEYFSTADEAKVLIACRITHSTNDRLIVYNETQSINKQKPVWEVRDNNFIASLKQFTISNEPTLVSMDFNGFIWKLEDSSKDGDGAEENGTATSGTTTTITDNTKNWTANAFVGMVVRIINGRNENEWATVTSNTSTQLIFTPAMSAANDSTTVYTVGGYDCYHFSNWLSGTKSYDTLKQLLFIFANLNASGDYDIELILQVDFDQTITNQVILTVNLQSANTIWGYFIWVQAIWGAQSVFQDRYPKFLRFRAIRLAFRNRRAGQPFQVNGFSLAFQDKGLFYKTAA